MSVIINKGDANIQATAPVYINVDLHARIKQLGRDNDVKIRTIVGACLREGLKDVQFIDKDGEN